MTFANPWFRLRDPSSLYVSFSRVNMRNKNGSGRRKVIIITFTKHKKGKRRHLDVYPLTIVHLIDTYTRKINVYMREYFGKGSLEQWMSNGIIRHL